MFIVISIIIVLSAYLFFKDKIRYKKTSVIILALLFFFYIFLVFQITVFSREEELQTELLYELIPFYSYFMMAKVGWFGWGVYIFYGLVGNVILFIPLGMLIPQIPKLKHPYLIAGIAGFSFSFGIELVQFFTMLGTFEVDDLIHNTWGAVIGCAIALALMKKEKSIKKNIKTLMPLVVFIGLIGSFSMVSILRDVIR